MDAQMRVISPGTLVDVVDAWDRGVATATFNPHALVALRAFGPQPGLVVDGAEIRQRLERALALRQQLFDVPCYRWVHADADGLPGVVVDRFGETLCVQLNTAGAEGLRAPLLEALSDLSRATCMVLRGDAPAREREGLALSVEVVEGSVARPTWIVENDTHHAVDPEGGQKTGWFFDHRENRAFLRRLCAGARVLDLYTYGGGFALQAARAGAREVLGVDRSREALDLAQVSADRNALASRIRWERADVFPWLEACSDRFDVVVADPPAFVKSRRHRGAGLRGYRKLARLAADRVQPGGFLVMASCSHHVSTPDFQVEVSKGLTAAERTGRLLRVSGAGPDHPVHPRLPETAYLSCLVYQVD